MVRSVEGVFRNGKIELLEDPPQIDDARVIITFIGPNGGVDLQARGVSAGQAKDLQRRLSPFAEDWNRPDMDAYDAL